MTGEVNSEPRGRLAWLTPREAFLNAFGSRGEALLDALGGGAIAVCVLSTSFERKSHRFLSSIRRGPAQPF